MVTTVVLRSTQQRKEESQGKDVCVQVTPYVCMAQFKSLTKWFFKEREKKVPPESDAYSVPFFSPAQHTSIQ